MQLHAIPVSQMSRVKPDQPRKDCKARCTLMRAVVACCSRRRKDGSPVREGTISGKFRLCYLRRAKAFWGVPSADCALRELNQLA